MGSRVEQFEQIRRDRDREGLSIRGLAVRHGVHRRTVKQALASPSRRVGRAEARREARPIGRRLLPSASSGMRTSRLPAPTWKGSPPRRSSAPETTRGPTIAARQRWRAAMGGWGGVRPAGPRAGMEAEVDWGEALVVFGCGFGEGSARDRVVHPGRRARRRWWRPSRRSWSCTCRRSSGSAACSRRSASTT